MAMVLQTTKMEPMSKAPARGRHSAWHWDDDLEQHCRILLLVGISEPAARSEWELEPSLERYWGDWSLNLWEPDWVHL